jgi:hypothetical protein
MAFARRTPTAFRPALVALAALALATALRAQAPVLPVPQSVANGIQLYHWDDPALLSPPGPVEVQALRLNPGRVTLRLAAASGHPPSRATVPDIAQRNQALAAINAGFFVVATGAPAGLLEIDKQLLAGTSLPRGALGIQRRSLFHPMRLVFDQVSASRPAPGGGAVQFRPRLGTPASAWARSADIVGGAGLLVHAGRAMTAEDWGPEKMRDGFTTERHPRTVVGVDRAGDVWLIVVDGRNPTLSLGMTFSELQALAGRLALSEALNLDGGGSTTMVVRGRVVNHPSDLTGPRPVSDALLVFAR